MIRSEAGASGVAAPTRSRYENSVRLLVLARLDVAGSWFHLSTALRQRGIADARVVTFASDPALGWPVDIADVFDGGQELEHLMRTAEAIHLVDLLPEDVGLFEGLVPRRCEAGQVRVSLQVDERPGPHRVREIGAVAARHGWSVVSTRPHVIPGAEFLAPFIPLWRAPWIPTCAGTRARTRTAERIVFASCATRLRDQPRLEALVERAEAAARELPDVRVEVLSGKAHDLVLQRRRRSHLALAGSEGLGRSGLEALAQGVATVAELSAADHEAWTDLAGSPPPIVPAFVLEAAMSELGREGEPDLERRRWAEAAADPRRWLDRCTAMWSDGSTRRAA